MASFFEAGSYSTDLTNRFSTRRRSCGNRSSQVGVFRTRFLPCNCGELSMIQVSFSKTVFSIDWALTDFVGQTA